MDAPSPSPQDAPSSRRRVAPATWDPSHPDIHRLLAEAEVAEMDLLPRGSNYTFLVRLASVDAGESLAVYKPCRGEAPLWDFPDGTLYRREYGAYLVSQALGWPAIPPTVIRSGPHGVGTVQLFIPHHPNAHYFTFGGRYIPELQRIAVFDAITNNADRKGGHCLEATGGGLWSIDHGLTFHRDYKLRTVIWDFRGEPIPEDILAGVQTLRDRLMQPADSLVTGLTELITSAELTVFRRRVEALLKAGAFPDMGPYRNTPWPAV